MRFHRLTPVVVATALIIFLGIAEECAMADMTSKTYRCPDGSELNIGSWWADPVASPAGDDSFIICGGNVPATQEGKGTDRCVRVDVDSCRLEALPLAMSTSRQDVRPVCLTRGQCYLFGGNTSDATPATMSVDKLSAETGDLERAVMTLPEPRLCCASAAIDGSKILITGGYGPKDPATGKGPVLASAVIVDTAKKSVEKIAMLHQRGGHSLTRLNDGTFLVVGGAGDDPSGAEIFDPKTKKFQAVASRMAAGRKDHRAILAKDGRVYIVGGTAPDKSQPVTVEVFDPKSKTFSDTRLKLSEGREDAAAVYIKELNSIVVVGGEQKGKAGEPESPAIDVIELDGKRVSSSKLLHPRDEPQVIVKGVDRKGGKMRLLVVEGQRKVDGKETSLPAEEIAIDLNHPEFQPPVTNHR